MLFYTWICKNIYDIDIRRVNLVKSFSEFIHTLNWDE